MLYPAPLWLTGVVLSVASTVELEPVLDTRSETWSLDAGVVCTSEDELMDENWVVDELPPGVIPPGVVKADCVVEVLEVEVVPGVV